MSPRPIKIARISSEGLGIATADWGGDREPSDQRPVCLEVPEKTRGIWTSEDADAKSMAKALCEDCPKRRSCLQLAIDTKACGGTYGGFSLGSPSEVRLAKDWLAGRTPAPDGRRTRRTRKAAS